jgi:hypothetical protein
MGTKWQFLQIFRRSLGAAAAFGILPQARLLEKQPQRAGLGKWKLVSKETRK